MDDARPVPCERRGGRDRHRDTYITEDDFRAISAHGLNLVRIPVPFFIFGDVPGHPGCVEYLDRAFDWAERAGLKVLIDLHTVPGSQNGFDNGGLTGVVRWHTTPRQVAFALDVLERLARRYRDRPALYGIEVLNEPVDRLTYLMSPSSSRAKDPGEARGSGHVPMRFLKRFYRAAYRWLRPVLGDGPVIVFHDGFRLNRWRGWFVREGMRGVIIDTHAYLVMSERPEVLFRILPDAWLMRWYRLFAASAVPRALRRSWWGSGAWRTGLRRAWGSAGRKVRSRPLMRLVVRSTDMVRSVTAVRMLETAHPVTSVRARATPGTASRRPPRAAAPSTSASPPCSSTRGTSPPVRSTGAIDCAAVAASLTVSRLPRPGTPP